MSSSAVSELPALKKALISASESKNKETISDILKKLLKITVTKEILKSTGVGQVVGKLRQFEDNGISQLAKNVVNKWKRDVTSSSKGTPVAQPSQAAIPTPPKPDNGSSNVQNGSTDATKSQTPSEQKTGSSAPAPAPTVTPSKPAAPTPAKPAGHAVPNANAEKKPESDRTAASDKVSFASVGDNVRQKCSEMLYNSLVIGSTVESNVVSDCAKEIESIEYDKAGNAVTPEYKARIRTLCLSLRNKDNPDLRKSIVDGSIAPKRFCTMSAEDMASEERKKLDAQIKQQNLFKAKGATTTQAETDMFRCSRCGKRKTTYYQMQTRSADEPMTTFVTCVECGNRWKFC
ncbi:transcription elongation factor TFIIS [Mycoemilia scoparia]|uniref:Transcription elongation factor n=1 Tax=Mycoemilia scoparia TaxID=417184 RepID=A0A9W8DQC0_9FUNG|nr:transcription elongation factor TFIIS [Mycoemilia scoparia]